MKSSAFVVALALAVPAFGLASTAGMAAVRACCMSCEGNRCQSCGATQVNRGTGREYCPLLETRASCNAKGVCTKGGWTKAKPGFMAGSKRSKPVTKAISVQ